MRPARPTLDRVGIGVLILVLALPVFAGVREVGPIGLTVDDFVITSYSIHYTKLYETDVGDNLTRWSICIMRLSHMTAIVTMALLVAGLRLVSQPVDKTMKTDTVTVRLLDETGHLTAPSYNFV